MKAKVCAVLLTLAATAASLSSARAQIQQQRFREDAEPRKESDKIDFFYKASRYYLLGATQLDMISTLHVLSHPTIAYRADGSVLARYYGIETGWARCFGRRDARAVIAANLALNAGIYLASRKLYQKGGRWRTLAIVINAVKATDNAMGGIHNVIYSTGVDEQLRSRTGYAGPIIWSQ